jgi:hypothetical protein
MWLGTTSAYTLIPAAWHVVIIDASWAAVPNRELRS